MPLYRVQVTYETVVLAADEIEAESRAIRCDVFMDEKLSTSASELKDRSNLPEPWTPNCHPYGDDHHTIAHYLK